MITVIGNLKGGSGKSTVAFNLAIWLAMQNKAFGVLQMIAARRGWDASFRFHFGPYIAIAGVAALLWGPAILAVVPALRPF